MRHLSRKYANRKSTLRNLATSLILYERIKTTTAKAKELKPVIERLLSRAAKNDLVAHRYLLSYLFDENATKKVIEVLVPRFKNIKSGYVKTYHLSPRLGDGAEMMIIELVKGEIKEEKIVEDKDAKNEKPKAGKEKSASGKTTTEKPVKAAK